MLKNRPYDGDSSYYQSSSTNSGISSTDSGSFFGSLFADDNSFFDGGSFGGGGAGGDWGGGDWGCSSGCSGCGGGD